MSTRREFLGTLAGATAATTLVGRPVLASPRKLLVSVITCPRPGGASYVDGTLAAVDAELSDHQRLLICDGSTKTQPGWFPCILSPRDRRRAGMVDNKEPGWMALEFARDLRADLLFLEDDIRPLVPGAFRRMAEHRMRAGAAFASFYSPDRSVGLHGAWEFNRSQAVKFSLETIDRLMRARSFRGGDWDALTGIDVAIGMLAWGERMLFEQVPNLVEHVGKVSAVAPRPA